MLQAADAVIAAIVSRGSDAHDLRDAVHEATHALQARCPPPWDRERIDWYLKRSCSSQDRVTALVDREVRARAAEMHACERFGVEYDLEQWSAIACMETGNTLQVWLKLDVIARRVKALASRQETRRLVDRIVKLGAK